MSRWANTAWIRQSRLSLASASVEAPDRLAEAHVIEFRCVDREAGLDVAQAFPVGQLGEGHGPVLLGAGKRPDPVIAANTGRRSA